MKEKTMQYLADAQTKAHEASQFPGSFAVEARDYGIEAAALAAKALVCDSVGEADENEEVNPFGAAAALQLRFAEAFLSSKGLAASPEKIAALAWHRTGSYDHPWYDLDPEDGLCRSLDFVEWTRQFLTSSGH